MTELNSAFMLNKQGDNTQSCYTSFPIWYLSVVPWLVLNCILTCILVSQEADKVVCSSSLFKNFPQFVVIHKVKDFSVVNEAEVVFFWNSPSLLPESSSSSQGISLKGWVVSMSNDAASHLVFLDCMFISSFRFSFIL